ncbi:MAG: hypothetical protein WEB88_17445 [Gemmatimonadota bacterium]
MRQEGAPVPFSFDMSALVRRQVASLYSHLVTRPTGRALRMGIESQIGELGSACLSVLDFSQVVVLDYSCADETVAKLLQRFVGPGKPLPVFFVARGLCEQHREPIESVLERHHLALVGEMSSGACELLGDVSVLERAVWDRVERRGVATAAEVAADLEVPTAAAEEALRVLGERRLLVRREEPETFMSLGALLAAG